MSLLDTLRKNLTPETLEAVTDQLGDDFDYDLVPRTRLNAVIKQRNDLRNQLAGGSLPTKTAPKQGKAGTEDDDDGPLDIEALKAQYQKQTDDAVNEVKLQYAALTMLRNADVIDPEMVWSSNAIDKTTLKMAADGSTVEGLSDIIAQLQKDKTHLFKAKEPPVPAGTGKENGGGTFKGVTDKEAFLKLSTEEQIAFKAAHPETFRSFFGN